MYKSIFLLLALSFLSPFAYGQSPVKLKKRDRRKDVELVTSAGTIVLRLSDSTPVHRDNFLRLVKTRYYDSILFHRVIRGFVIQAGDAATKGGLQPSSGDTFYRKATLPAEFRTTLFHQKGALAAAREGDAVNPEKRSSPYQFYIVQGRTFTDEEMDSVERVRLNGRKLSPHRRQVYKTVGGTPQLDGNYTVFGEVIRGLAVVDSIAAVPVGGVPPSRPVTDIRILKTVLIKRKKG